MTIHKTFTSTRIALILGAAVISGGKAAADFVIPDDLIVQGSACVGFDCVDGEPFGFDTIRLKENNLRILFMDTSVAPFPTNDWQLTANDSASGGASKFSIEDITGAKVPFTVTAGAPTNSMFVANTGKVGFRTSAPALDLHVTTGDTPAHRFEQTNASGFTAQTWDVAGNEANFFVRDLTGGGRLPFRIRPGAPTSSLDIAASGDIGIGTASPGAFGTGGTPKILQVHNTGTSLGLLNLSNIDAALGAIPGAVQFSSLGISATEKRLAAIAAIKGDASTATPNGSLLFLTANAGAPAERMRIDNAGNIGIGTTAATARLDVNGTVRVATLGANPPANTVCFSATNVLGTCASDARLKHNVRYLQESAGLDAVMKLKPATFQWQDGDERMMAGFIAQETQAAIPEAVHKPAGSEFLSLDSAAILSYAVRAIQELKADNDRLRGDIERLKASR